MRVFVVDNGLKSAAGHHLNNAIGLMDALRGRGVETSFLINKAVDVHVAQAVSGDPVFSFTPYDRISGDELSGELESFMLQGRVLGAELGRAISGKIRSEDVIVVATATHIELLALSTCLARIAESSRPRVVCNFIKEHFANGVSGSYTELAKYYRFAFKSLAAHLDPSTLFLSANSDAMACALSHVFEREVVVLPIPKIYPPCLISAVTSRRPGKDLVIGVFGDMNSYKGFGYIPQLVRSNPCFSWVIQSAKSGNEKSWGRDCEWVSNCPNVRIVPGGLLPDEYYRLYSRVDIVLLPYNPDERCLQTSGVFAESVASGRVVVCPATAWIEQKSREGKWAGVCFSRQDLEAISAALAHVASNFDELRRKALDLAPKWAASECVASFVDAILKKFENNAQEKAR